MKVVFWRIAELFMPSMWAYLFDRRRGRNYYEVGIFRMAWCRYRGHPNGVIWFNLGGQEPDMTCVDCGDDLG